MNLKTLIILLASLCFNLYARDERGFSPLNLYQLPERAVSVELSPADSTHDYQQQIKELQALLNNYEQLSSQLRQNFEEFTAIPEPQPGEYYAAELSTLLQAYQTSRSQVIQRIDQIREEQNTIDQDISLYHQRRETLTAHLGNLERYLKRQPFEALSPNEESSYLHFLNQEERAKAQLQVLDLTRQSAPNRNALLQLELSLLERQSNNYNNLIEVIQSQLAKLQRSAAEQLASQIEIISPQLLEITEVKQLIASNQEIQNHLSALVEKNILLQQNQQAVFQELLYIKQTFANFQEQVSWLQVTRVYGDYLREQISNLPPAQALAPIESQIVSTRIKKQRYQNQLYQLNHSDTYSQLLQASQHLSPELQRRASDLYQFNLDLLNRYLNDLDNHLFELAKLALDYTRLNQELASILESAQQELFWTADIQALDLNFLSNLQQSLTWWFKAEHLQDMLEAIKNLPFYWYFISLICLTSAVYTRYLKEQWLGKYLLAIDQKTRNITKDKFTYTLANILLSILISLPLPIFLLSTGYAFTQSWEQPFAQNIGFSLQQIARLLLLFSIFSYFSMPYGLFHTHLKWSQLKSKLVMTQLKPLIYFSLPLLFIVLVSLEQYKQVPYAGLAQLCFMLLMFWVSFQIYKMSKIEFQISLKINLFKAPDIVNRAVTFIAITLPLGFAMSAALGYLSTSFLLFKQILLSLLIAGGFFLCYGLIRRGMFLQKRRIAFERAKQKRIEKIAMRSLSDEEKLQLEQQDNFEEPSIDLNTISSQSLGLFKAVLFVAYLILFIVSWSEMTSVFSFLDSVTLWEVQGSRENQIESITLRSVGNALLILIVTLTLLRNLPGMLELMILQHLSLSPGSGFAITSIINNIVTLFGVILGFSWLGLDWSKLQWMAAALTVGLGFGLREIFANFISGFIILFEKPIRIGDTVTVGTLNGTVSKIESRATTVLDWDRKEIIVPNKAFVTEQFTNWSLSDPITRVVLELEVKHHQDLNQVTELLENCITSAESVLDNPAPQVYFRGYNDNGARFELRVHVSEMRYRLPVTHEVFLLVSQCFKENGIEVAFPQRQVAINEPAKAKSATFAKRVGKQN